MPLIFIFLMLLEPCIPVFILPVCCTFLLEINHIYLSLYGSASDNNHRMENVLTVATVLHI